MGADSDVDRYVIIRKLLYCGMAETAVARPIPRQWLSCRNMLAATDTHATIEEQLESVFSVRSVLRLYEED
jgi:hypothetical protein